MAFESVAAEATEQNANAVVSGWIPPMIDKIPAPDREALQLAEIEGLPQAEVTERLGLSLSGAKSRIQRARARLRQKILDCCELEMDRRGNVLDWSKRSEKPC